MRLYRSAERAGGQQTFMFFRYRRAKVKFDYFGARPAARKGQNAPLSPLLGRGVGERGCPANFFEE